MRSVITRGLLKIPPRSLFPFVTEPWAGDDGMSGWWWCGAYIQIGAGHFIIHNIIYSIVM